MSGSVSLEDLRGAYRRTSSRIYRILEDGYDFSTEAYLIETLDRDARIIDAAFFVLIFGQIENRLNGLAAQRGTAISSGGPQYVSFRSSGVCFSHCRGRTTKHSAAILPGGTD